MKVFATVRNPSKFPSDVFPSDIEVLALEVHKPESIAALKDAVSSRTGGQLSILVNNAGSNYTVPALDVNVDEVKSMFEANVFGVMRMCQTFAPMLIEAKGTIVQIGSLAGVMPYAFGAAYNASKAALHAYSDTLRIEVAPFDVKVVTVVTGGIKTNLQRVERELPKDSYYLPINSAYEKRLKYSERNAMSPEEYAKSVADKVLRNAPPKQIWEGAKVTMVWILVTFLPKTVMEMVFTRIFDLWKLRGTAEGKKLD